MMRRLVLVILLTHGFLLLNAQREIVASNQSGLEFSDSSFVYRGNVKLFTLDNLGNLYVLTRGGLLIKYNSHGDSLNVFNDIRRYGPVYDIDATNPLKILIHYGDFGAIVTLDRFLNRINKIDLRQSGIFQSRAIGFANDNKIWVFDEQSAKLKKIDDNGRVLSETPDLRQVLNVLPDPEKIIDRDGFVYLYDRSNGLYIFDYYGTLKNELALKGLTDFQITDKTVTGRRNGNLILYTPGTLNLNEQPLPPSMTNTEKIFVVRKGIFTLNADGIVFYHFKTKDVYE